MGPKGFLEILYRKGNEKGEMAARKTAVETSASSLKQSLRVLQIMKKKFTQGFTKDLP